MTQHTHALLAACCSVGLRLCTLADRQASDTDITRGAFAVIHYTIIIIHMSASWPTVARRLELSGPTT